MNIIDEQMIRRAVLAHIWSLSFGQINLVHTRMAHERDNPFIDDMARACRLDAGGNAVKLEKLGFLYEALSQG